MKRLNYFHSFLGILFFSFCLLCYTSCTDNSDDCTLFCDNGILDEEACDCLCDPGWEGLNCDTPICPENGTLNESLNICECNSGFEGDSCDIVTRDRYRGSYRVTEASPNPIEPDPDCEETLPYNSEITIGDEIDEIFIENLGNFECDADADGNFNDSYFVLAYVEGDNLTIPVQDVCGGALSISGDAFLEEGTVESILTFTYTASFADDTEPSGIYSITCKAEFKK